MRVISWIVMPLAVLGLIASMLVYLAACLGLNLHMSQVKFLHIGIFFVIFPGIWHYYHIADETPRKELINVVLRGCPAWLRMTVKGLMIYAVINGVLIGSLHKGRLSDLWTLRAFSGAWMGLYAVAFALAYASVQLKPGPRRCPTGHGVTAVAKFCSECGSPVSD